LFANIIFKLLKKINMGGIGAVPTMEIGVNINIAFLQDTNSKVEEKWKFRKTLTSKKKLIKKGTNLLLKIDQVH